MGVLHNLKVSNYDAALFGLKLPFMSVAVLQGTSTPPLGFAAATANRKMATV